MTLPRPSGGGPSLPLGSVLRQLSAETVLAAKAAGLPSTAVPTDLQASMIALSNELSSSEAPALHALHLAARTASEHDAAVHCLSGVARFLGL